MKQEIKKSLKNGCVSLGVLNDIYNANDEDLKLTPEEIKRLDEIERKILNPDKLIALTIENKREILKFLHTGEEAPMTKEFFKALDYDKLSKDERQFLVEISTKLETENRHKPTNN